MTPPEPQSAADYDDRTTAAVKSVLIEIGQILGSFRGKFAVVGGAVPWLLLDQRDMPHVGTLDIDLGLDAEALGDGEYAALSVKVKATMLRKASSAEIPFFSRAATRCATASFWLEPAQAVSCRFPVARRRILSVRR